MPNSPVKTRVLCVFGTRPDAVKMAPVVREFSQRADRFAVRVVVTGQHREQLDQVLSAFAIRPDADLAIMRHGQSLTHITTAVLGGLDSDLEMHPQDVCLAQGDTTTTFVAALAAFYHRVPFGHVEAGLRTGNVYDPFPEEMNRKLAASLAAWHFAPTEQARKNLLAEGIAAADIEVTGNTSIDALKSVAGMEYRFEDAALRAIVEGDRRLILVTAHRRENWGAPMRSIGGAIARIAARFRDCEVVVAMHRNPVVRDDLRTVLDGAPGVHLIEPPDYVPFVKLMQRASLILTDSGGVQEEAPTFGVPILVLRKTTERPEGVAAGSARLVGTDADAIVDAAADVLCCAPKAFGAGASCPNPYGDGDAAARILRRIEADVTR